MPEPTLRCEIRRGTIRLPNALCAEYFGGLHSVALLVRDGDLWIFPVRHAAAGGYLLKVRNSAGDRMIDAIDLFRMNGIKEDGVYGIEAVWDQSQMALCLPLPHEQH